MTDITSKLTSAEIPFTQTEFSKFGYHLRVDLSRGKIRPFATLMLENGYYLVYVGGIHLTPKMKVVYELANMDSGHRSLGMAEGSANKKIIFNYIPKEDLVYAGDIIMTSEFGKYIPPEILIGIVKKATTSESSPYKIIEIEPFVNFRTIENVLVIQEW